MNHFSKNHIAIAITAMLVGGLIVWLVMPQPTLETRDSETITAGQDHVHETIWTCSMHPQIRQAEPGQCPICGMDLIPLGDEESDRAIAAVRMSPTAMQLADVETAVVGRGTPEKVIHLNGKIAADQRLTYSQTSHIPGRIEDLRIDFTGERVRSGDVLALVYSPALITAQNELIQAGKIKDDQPALYEAARRKLKNWKLTDAQIESIEDGEAALGNFPINADQSGYVIEKMVELGDYVERGQSLYRIADLNRVWVMFDVYESDMAWIEKGDRVEFTVASLPGRSFTGQIDYLDPVLDPKTRVSEARVEISNTDGALRPGMFASGKVYAGLELGSEKLIVPKSAVMWTGTRSLVYVKSVSDKGTEFTMRQIILGPTLGDGYIVEEGLTPGEEIAVHGTFSIDAAAQLAGKPSMMSPEGGAALTGHNHGGTGDDHGPSDKSHYTEIAVGDNVKQALHPVIEAYLNMKNALVDDDAATAKKFAADMETALTNVSMSLFVDEAHTIWVEQSEPLKRLVSEAAAAEGIESIRRPFSEISERLEILARVFKPFDRPLYVQFCPMANDDRGAEWLSLDKDVKNPYFGEAMLQCGEVKESIE